MSKILSFGEGLNLSENATNLPPSIVSSSNILWLQCFCLKKHCDKTNIAVCYQHAAGLITVIGKSHFDVKNIGKPMCNLLNHTRTAG